MYRSEYGLPLGMLLQGTSGEITETSRDFIFIFVLCRKLDGSEKMLC